MQRSAGVWAYRLMTDREAAEFIADHAKELARIARAAGFSLLGDILEKAAEEAALIIKSCGPRERRPH
jgi:hypothetical protein